jgi:hypothetical protein
MGVLCFMDINKEEEVRDGEEEDKINDQINFT